jgi:hypothetical protein
MKLKEELHPFKNDLAQRNLNVLVQSAIERDEPAIQKSTPAKEIDATMTEERSLATRRSSRLWKYMEDTTDPFFRVVAFASLKCSRRYNIFTYTGIYRLLVHQLRFFVFFKSGCITQKKHRDFVVPSTMESPTQTAL